MCTMQNILLKDYPYWWRILPKKEICSGTSVYCGSGLFISSEEMHLGVEAEQEGDAGYLLPCLFLSNINGNFNYSYWESRIVL